jgi:hypothetical protein
MSDSSVIDRIKTSLVGLKMPRALEILDATLRGIERGEVGAIEAIDALLTEELTMRENRASKWRYRWPSCRRSKRSPASTLPASPRSIIIASWRSPDCSSSIGPKPSIS